MCRPLAVKTCRFITDDPAVPVEVLRGFPALPSCYMSDDGIFWGEYPVVGNLPLEACIAARSRGPCWERTKDWALKDLRSPF